MEKVVVWYEIRDAQDGSAWMYWHMTEPEWREFQMATGSVETFVGSDIHRSALSDDDE